jgi:hypothetical protein
MSHYSLAQKPAKLKAWANKVANSIKEEGIFNPVLVYTGMSGIAGATALSLALNDLNIKHGMAYIRKEHEQSHGEAIEFDVVEKDGKFFKFHIYGTYSDIYNETYDHEIILEDEVSEAEVKGSVELLWETFGGTVTEQGYKVLDSHTGLIYGDSITPAVALDVFQRLEAKGFASTNIVFGVGSYTMQYVTRDSLGMAVKATYAEVGGKGYELFKDPITDSGMKKSAKGLLRVEKEGDDYVLYDQQTLEQEQQGELKTVFRDGKLVAETSLSEIRQRLWS